MTSVYDCDDINVAVQNFSSVLLNYFKTCPIKTRTLSYKRKMKPWITDDMVGYIKKRQKYYLLYKQGKIRREFYN